MLIDYLTKVFMNVFNTLTGNFIAIGSMDPAIEIWDLDVVCTLWTFNSKKYIVQISQKYIVCLSHKYITTIFYCLQIDAVEPCLVLGGQEEVKKKKGKKVHCFHLFKNF